MRKNVVVIGGGIAGLSAGVYAQKCGFDVTILESHSIAGGNCTAWKRKGYLFEGGMHWLTGTGKNEPMYTVWKHIGALDDSVEIHHPEPYREFSFKDTTIRLHRDVDATEKHLIAVSPEDEKEIRALCNSVRKVKRLVMPLWDLKGVKVTKKRHPGLRSLFNFLSANRAMKKFSKISKEEYINKYKHEGIREFFSRLLASKASATWLCFSLGTQARGDGGFPHGGSLPFVGRIVKTYKDAGGKIVFNKRVDRIVIENGKAVGVEAGGLIYPADAVIVASDTMQMEHLFETQPKAAWLDEMKQKAEPTMGVLVSLGVNADLTKYNKDCIFKLEKPIYVFDVEHPCLNVTNYANDPTYSPEGKAAVTLLFVSDTYDQWKEAREKGRYEEEKEKFAKTVIDALVDHMPEIAGNVEVYDVATPLTYERYCANWRGSWMTMMVGRMNMRAYPAVSDNLSGVYFAGHRMRPPGGLPIAAMSGRTAVQYLCRDTGTLFISEE